MASKQVKEGLIAVNGDRLLAFFDARQSAPLSFAKQADAVGVSGKLAAGKSARLVVYLPAWPVKPAEYAVLGNTSQWAIQTDQYWKDVLAGAMQIDIPDPSAGQRNPRIAGALPVDGPQRRAWQIRCPLGFLDMVRGMGRKRSSVHRSRHGHARAYRFRSASLGTLP